MMSTSSGFKNGSRSLNHSLNRCLDRGCSRWSTSMLGGARRPPRPNGLKLACRLLTHNLRLPNRMGKDDPHLFGPPAQRYFLDTLQLERHEQDVEAAIRKVYGSPTPGEPARVSTLWTDRYFPKPEQRKMFLHWFNENYPSK